MSLTRGDLLSKLFTLPPIVVALIILVWGWGNLFVVAISTHSLGSFLTHPAFMIGDLVMLPAAGFLITLFYQRVETPMHVAILFSKKWTCATLSVAFLLALYNAYFSIFIWKSAPPDILMSPHFFFWWFFVYVLINFLARGFGQLLYTTKYTLWLLYVGVIILVSVHLLLPTVFGPKTFPISQ